MLAEESLRQGNLEESLAELQQRVRSAPSDPKLRVFLFQLLAVLGQWDRALNQLNVSAELDASTLAMAQTYRTALGCETLRAEVFAGRRSPLVFGEPEPWIALLLQAVRQTAEDHHEQARDLRDRAFDAAPAVSGTIEGTPFEWIADADTRLGPVLEAIVNGAYYWVPFHRIREIRIDAPEDLRDAVWMPAQFTWSNGGETVGLIPTRYPGSEASTDGGIRLARRTEWLEPSPGAYQGLGQRMLATDAGEYPLMDVRRIEIAGAAPGDGDA
ncbi:MAG: virulence protein SciE type [Deltaproteobacteria bacterium]|nr:virulence protein SciE type [Deltaproteobacteria bacterium]